MSQLIYRQSKLERFNILIKYLRVRKNAYPKSEALIVVPLGMIRLAGMVIEDKRSSLFLGNNNAKRKKGF